jgi:hypothetical protein
VDESKLAETVHDSGIAPLDDVRSTRPATSNKALSLEVEAE